MDTIPLYSRLTAAISRPLVLLAALVISMPAEIQLARSSGFSHGFEYLMPLTLSLYSSASAVIAATRPRGTKGRASAIAGSGLALFLALSAQVVGHLTGSGYMTSGPVLVSLVSSVPALAACHMLHLCTTPKATVGVTKENPGHETTEESENDDKGAKATTPAAPRKKGAQGRRPSLQVIREAAQNLDAVGELVTGRSLGQALGVSTRTGARYLSALNAA